MFAQCFLSCRKTLRYRTVLVEEVVAITVAVTVVVALTVAVSVTMAAVAVSVTMAAVADHKDEDVWEEGDNQDQWQEQTDRGAGGRRQLPLETPRNISVSTWRRGGRRRGPSPS